MFRSGVNDDTNDSQLSIVRRHKYKAQLRIESHNNIIVVCVVNPDIQKSHDNR